MTLLSNVLQPKVLPPKVLPRSRAQAIHVPLRNPLMEIMIFSAAMAVFILVSMLLGNLRL